MKIAVACSGLGHILRGVEAWAEDLGVALHARGMDVTLFKGGGRATRSFERALLCAHRDEPLAFIASKLFHHGGWRLGLSSSYGVEQTTFAFFLRPELRRGHFDIVHTQDPQLARLLQTARRNGAHSAEVILAHGTEESFDFLRHFDHVQELAPWHLEMDRQQGLAPDRLWFAIPNFVDCETYSPGDQMAARKKLGLPLNRFIVLDVAALKITHKRLDWLAHETALARRQHPEIMLVVAGATSEETPAVERAMQTELGEHYRLLKDVPRDTMPEVYRAADLFAHTALKEMLAIVLLEAMASGLSVWGSTHPVIQWVFGEAGDTVDMEQEGALAAGLIASFRDAGRRRQRGPQARQRAVELFDTAPVVDQIIAMYDAVVAKRTL